MEEFGIIKDWIISRPADKVQLTDVLSKFPDISVVRTKERTNKASEICTFNPNKLCLPIAWFLMRLILFSFQVLIEGTEK